VGDRERRLKASIHEAANGSTGLREGQTRLGVSGELNALLVLIATGIGVVIGFVTGASEPVAVGDTVSNA